MSIEDRILKRKLRINMSEMNLTEYLRTRERKNTITRYGEEKEIEHYTIKVCPAKEEIRHSVLSAVSSDDTGDSEPGTDSTYRVSSDSEVEIETIIEEEKEQKYRLLETTLEEEESKRFMKEMMSDIKYEKDRAIIIEQLEKFLKRMDIEDIIEKVERVMNKDNWKEVVDKCKKRAKDKKTIIRRIIIYILLKDDGKNGIIKDTAEAGIIRIIVLRYYYLRRMKQILRQTEYTTEDLIDAFNFVLVNERLHRHPDVTLSKSRSMLTIPKPARRHSHRHKRSNSLSDMYKNVDDEITLIFMKNEQTILTLWSMLDYKYIGRYINRRYTSMADKYKEYMNEYRRNMEETTDTDITTTDTTERTNTPRDIDTPKSVDTPKSDDIPKIRNQVH